ncbi:uroporphyrinogen-III synthase [Acinetobacter ihumii]|uniref:uroporphyrinogen-III synthase n=1 Tax=Acinetobacter ihumii TaxID=2483802 RepID=UPI0010304084|nr:uroporphyrinogen-III synthase [Acinetobacter ihumii]
MLFINTRPKDRAEKLNQHLRAAGYQVVDYPLLELVAQPYSDALATLYGRLGQTQMIVVVSPTAAEIGLRYLLKSGWNIAQLTQIKWIAVGRGTADYLAQYSIRADVPEIETSEGMLQLDLFKDHKNLKQIAFWRGEGGRQLMMQQLLAQGVDVLNFVLYSRHCPDESIRQVFALQQQLRQTISPITVLISSETSWRNWQSLMRGVPSVCHDCCYMVLGKRLFDIVNRDQAEQQHVGHVCCVDDLKPDSILAQLKVNEG